MPRRLALFDCDGTLIDGQASICEAMEAAFAAHALPAPDRNQVRRLVGLSLPVAVRRLLPEAEAGLHEALVDSYKLAFRTARSQGRLAQPLVPGMRDLLISLRESGWLLGVATGMSDRGLAHCLAENGVSNQFVTLQTADRHPSKPDPSMAITALAEADCKPARAVMIGDTVFDIEMALAAGMRGIGVAWGYHEPADLIAAGAIDVAQNVEQLRELIA